MVQKPEQRKSQGEGPKGVSGVAARTARRSFWVELPPPERERGGYEDTGKDRVVKKEGGKGE